MKRKHKKYSRPKKPFDSVRMEEEGKLKKEFGLKNKKEIWKADAQVKSMRTKAKKLIKSSPEEQKILFTRLKKRGYEVNSISDVLALNIRNHLGRRLQTIVAQKKISSTVKGARQLITHKKILVDNKAVDSPSYLVSVEMEGKISLKSKKEDLKKEKILET